MISIISNYALSMKATLCFTRINSKQFFMKLIENHKNKYTRKEFCLRVIKTSKRYGAKILMHRLNLYEIKTNAA